MQPLRNLTSLAPTKQVFSLWEEFRAFAFKGNGLVDIWAPEGAGSGWATVAVQGINLGAAWLQGPASGSYGAGNHPLILFQLQASAAATTAATGFDLIAMQS